MRPRRPAPIIIRMDATAIRGLTMRLLPLLPVAGDGVAGAGVAAGVTGAGAGRVGAAADFSMTVASFVMAASSATAALFIAALACMHLVDPPAGQINKSGEVLRPGQPRGLKAAHLAGGGSGP